MKPGLNLGGGRARVDGGQTDLACDHALSLCLYNLFSEKKCWVILKKNLMARPRGRRNFLVLSGIDSANECCRICNGKKSTYTYVYLFPLCVRQLGAYSQRLDGAHIQLCPADLTHFSVGTSYMANSSVHRRSGHFATAYMITSPCIISFLSLFRLRCVVFYLI